MLRPCLREPWDRRGVEVQAVGGRHRSEPLEVRLAAGAQDFGEDGEVPLEAPG